MKEENNPYKTYNYGIADRIIREKDAIKNQMRYTRDAQDIDLLREKLRYYDTMLKDLEEIFELKTKKYNRIELDL